MITIAFSLEAVLFALAGGLIGLREARKDREEAAATRRSELDFPRPPFPRPPAVAQDGRAADTTWPVTAPPRRERTS
jgi:hypothetical protein